MTEVQWFYARDSVQTGPVSTVQLRQLAAGGQIAPTDLVWREGMENWAPASRVKGLFAEPKASSPEPAAPAPNAAVSNAPASNVATSDAVREAALATAVTPEAGLDEALAGARPLPVAEPTARAARRAAPKASLRSVLLLVQWGLWGTCVLVVLVGGLVLIGALVAGKSAADQAASATVLGALFIGAYVLARAGERISLLVGQHVSSSAERAEKGAQGTRE